MRRTVSILSLLSILSCLWALANLPATARTPAQAAPEPLAPTVWPAHWPTRSPLADRLAAPLEALLRAYREHGPAAAARYAQSRRLGDGAVARVVVYADDRTSAANLGAELGAIGFVMETHHDQRVQGLIPVAELERLATAPGVRTVRSPLEPVLAAPASLAATSASTITSEGIAVIGADVWQAAGHTGAGVKVAVLDLGFAGYGALLGNELPAVVVTQSFASGGLEAGGEAHGTACAEIVHDTAPGVELYLVNFNTDVEFANAVDWIISSTVDIVSCSVGWPIGGPGDGTGPIADEVAAAASAGLLWVNSAGNHAQYHWMGAYADADSDTLLDFDAGDYTNRISATVGDAIRVGMRWDDIWGDVKNNFTLELYDSTFSLVAYESLPATGPLDPTRFLSWVATASGDYDIVVRRLDSNATAPAIELFSYDQQLTEYYTSTSSILVPSDVADALAVGAVPHNFTFMVESFSSQGPSRDGRLKPDLVAPDRVSSLTYGDWDYGIPGSGFWGTSAACPHVAGAAALLWSAHPYLDNDGVASRLRSEAQDIEPPTGPDIIAGYGRLQLGSVVTPTFTPTFTPTPTRTPTATATDLPTIPPPPTQTATPTWTSTPTLSPTPGPSPTPSVTPTPSNTPLPTATGTPTLTVTPGPSPTASDTPTPSNTPLPTATGTPTLTVTPGPSPTASDTPTPGATLTPTPTRTITPGPFPTASDTPTPTITLTPTRTVTPGPSPTPTRTFTPYPSATPWPAGWQKLAFSGYVVRDVIVDPNNPDRVMICTAGDDLGIFLSVNGGDTWTPVNTGLTDRNIYQLAQEPGAAWIVYAASENALWRSVNIGASWQEVTPASVTDRLSGLATAPKHSGRVYTTALSPCGAIYASTDSGGAWNRHDGADLCAYDALDSSVQVSAQNPDKLYLARAHDRPELYRSTAGGASWTRLANIGDGVGVYDLALDAANDQRLYAATANMGIFTTLDGGNTWSMVGYGLPYNGIGVKVTALALDPGNAQIVYAALDNGEVYRTTVGGYWWTAYGGSVIPAAVYTLRIAPNRPRRLWAASSDGLWTMDVFAAQLPMIIKNKRFNVTPTITPTRTLTPSRTPTPTITPTRPPTPTNCYEAIKNGGFESVGNWDIATTPHSAGYTNEVVLSGSVALRTGIKSGEANVTSHSSAGQLFLIPVNATSATLRYYRQRHTEETPASAELPEIASGAALARSLLPYDQDWQEVLLLDSYYNVLAFVERGRGNDSGWVERTFDLTPYRGRWVVLYFNTYNDGVGGVSWMFVDDVSVGVCR